MRMYWAARTTIQLLQVAQYADTLMQQGGSALSSSTKTQPQSPGRGYTCNQLQRDVCGRSHESQKESYAVVAIVETASVGKQRTRIDGYQETTCRASTPTTPTTPRLGYCPVYRSHGFAMKRCLFHGECGQTSCHLRRKLKPLFFSLNDDRIGPAGQTNDR